MLKRTQAQAMSFFQGLADNGKKCVSHRAGSSGNAWQILSNLIKLRYGTTPRKAIKK